MTFEDLQVLAVIVRDIGLTAVVFILGTRLMSHLVTTFSSNEARGDGLLEKALESMGQLSSAINGLRETETKRNEISATLVNQSEKTYQQLETLTLATERSIGLNQTIASKVETVHGIAVTLQTLHDDMKAGASDSAESRDAVARKLVEVDQHLLTLIGKVNHVITLTTPPAPPRPTNADGAKAEPQASEIAS